MAMASAPSGTKCPDQWNPWGGAIEQVDRERAIAPWKIDVHPVQHSGVIDEVCEP